MFKFVVKFKCLHGGVVLVVSASPPGAADLAIRGGRPFAARVRVFGAPDVRVVVLGRVDQAVRNGSSSSSNISWPSSWRAIVIEFDLVRREAVELPALLEVVMRYHGPLVKSFVRFLSSKAFDARTYFEARCRERFPNVCLYSFFER